MKKILLLLLMVVFLSNLKAQDSENITFGKIYIGAKAGYGIVNFKSTVSSEKDFAETTYDNLSYGIIAGYKLSGKLSLQVEGNYSQYGADKIIPTYIYSPDSPLLNLYGSNTVVDHVDMDLFYADIPLTLNYSFSGGGFSPYIYFGANWGINISGSATIKSAIKGSDIYQEFTDDITGSIKYNEFAPIVGGGIKIKLGSLNVFGDVRYKYGVQNLSNVYNDLGFTNRAVWLSAGIVLNL